MYFCIQCVTGREPYARDQIKRFLKDFSDTEFEVWFPEKEVTERKARREQKHNLPLFPGYIFLWWNGETEKNFPFKDISPFTGIIRFLKYGDGSHSLTGRDLKYASWIHDNNGFISQSKVLFKKGQKIHIVSGPLVGFDGNVIKVDKHHKRITLRFEIGETPADISFSVDFLQLNAAKEATQN